MLRSRILLTPGFIKGYTATEFCLVAKILTYMMNNRGKGRLWEDELKDYPERITNLAKQYWHLMESKGTIDIDQKKEQKRIESERKLLYSSSLEHEQGREIGAEGFACKQYDNLPLTISCVLKVGMKNLLRYRSHIW